MGLLSTLYFFCFHYFGLAVAHFHFFTSYTTYSLLFLSFWAPLSPFTSSRPICLSHGPVIHFSCHLGLMHPSTSYFLYFHYFGLTVAHSRFSTSYTTHGFLFLSFYAPLNPFTSLRPICLSHGPVIYYSCRLDLMGFLSICQISFLSVLLGFSFPLGLPKWPSTKKIYIYIFI